MIEGVDVRAQPRFHLLVARGLGPGVGTGAERGDEEGSLPGYAGDAVVNRNRRSGPIDEGFLAGLVLLPHHYVELLAPALIQFAETAVAVALGVGVAVLFPEQLQGDVAVGAELLVDGGEVGRDFFGCSFASGDGYRAASR